jgi:hypothetical protein
LLQGNDKFLGSVSIGDMANKLIKALEMMNLGIFVALGIVLLAVFLHG